MKRSPSSSRRGFTLAELIVALFVLGIFVAGATVVLVNSTKSYLMTLGRLGLNHDFRTLTENITKDGRTASSYRIYRSFADRTDVTFTEGGDYLVFQYFDNNNNVIRTTGYYRDKSNSGFAPVRRHDSAHTGSPTDLPATGTASHWPIVVQFAQGDYAQNGSVGALFKNNKPSIMINGQIRNDGDAQGRMMKEGVLRPSLSTYNFCVGPRG